MAESEIYSIWCYTQAINSYRPFLLWPELMAEHLPDLAALGRLNKRERMVRMGTHKEALHAAIDGIFEARQAGVTARILHRLSGEAVACYIIAVESLMHTVNSYCEAEQDLLTSARGNLKGTLSSPDIFR